MWLGAGHSRGAHAGSHNPYSENTIEKYCRNVFGNLLKLKKNTKPKRKK
jgi:hypothetical protein